MKASSQIAVLCLAAGACGRTVVPRDLATFTGVLGDVQNGIDNLDQAVNAFNGNPAPVKKEAEELVKTIHTGTSSVQASTPLSGTETISLLAPVNNLKAHAKNLSGDFKARRADVAAAKQCDETRQQISNIDTATENLIGEIVEKVPTAYKSIAQDQAGAITKILKDTQDYFAPDQCQNAA